MEVEDSQRITLHKKIRTGTRAAARARNQETVTANSQDLRISRNQLHPLEKRCHEDPTQCLVNEKGQAGPRRLTIISKGKSFEKSETTLFKVASK